MRRIARRRGFVDPFDLLARLRRFSEPSEVQEPIELVRAGVVFHSRGLINTKVFQYHLDWVWPYWVNRQFDPDDPSFLPRAFSFSHVNLTHRNWTALGLPGLDQFPIVDPRGLVTLPEDPWSLDWWFLPSDGAALFPSREVTATQRLDMRDELSVVTHISTDEATMETRAGVTRGDNGNALLRLNACVTGKREGFLVLATRPANPEGVHFIESIGIHSAQAVVNDRHAVRTTPAPDHWAGSVFARGDVAAGIHESVEPGTILRCPSGLATAAAVFAVSANQPRTVEAVVNLDSAPNSGAMLARKPGESWSDALQEAPRLEIPNEHWRFLHEAAMRTIILLSPGDIFPGPSTYRRFWFRDACLIMNALLAISANSRVRRALERFPARQKKDGYFHSQEGEWDSNGQVLWIANRYERMTGQLLPARMIRLLNSGAEWISRKRISGENENRKGLFPPGFSAEHLGPVDYYYWDNFWGIAGLRAAGSLNKRRGKQKFVHRWEKEADEFAKDLRRSLAKVPPVVASDGVPAGPGRRMDAGAIGSLVADYPLQLDDIVDEGMTMGTADWLWRRSSHEGAFFQQMIHSGANAYLSLALAQTFLRFGDPRFHELIDAVANLASPTGQWPEAIHPRTGGGCMGDGQHAWAAAEWILMMRSLFLREESDSLIIGSGLPADWFKGTDRLGYGPTATQWGSVRITFSRKAERWHLLIDAEWFGSPPEVCVNVPGFAPKIVTDFSATVELHPQTVLKS